MSLIMCSGLRKVFLKGSAFRRIAISIAWLAWERGLGFVLQFTVGLWVIRYLGPEDFGTLSYCLSIGLLAGGIAVLGIDQNVTRDLAADPGDARGILGAAMLCRLGGAAVVAALLVALAVGTADRQAASALVVLALPPLTAALGAPAWLWFMARIEAQYPVLARNAGLVCSAGYRLALIGLGTSMAWFAGAVLIENAVIAVVCGLFFVRRARYWPLPRRADAARVLPLLRRSWPLLLAGIALFVNMQIDIVMLQHLAGPGETGIYAAAVRLSEAPYFIPVIVAGSCMPYLVTLAARDRMAYERRIRHVLRLLLTLAFVLGAGIALGADLIIALLLGAGYADVASILRLHTWSLVFVSFGCLSSQLLINEGAQKTVLAVTASGATVNALLNLVLIPAFGGIGAAWATLVSYAVSGSLALPFCGERARWVLRLQGQAVMGKGFALSRKPAPVREPE